MFHRVPSGFRNCSTGQANLRQRLGYALRGVTSEEVAAFMHWLGQAFGFSEPPATLGVADKMVPWLYREWKRAPRIDPGKVLAVRDWWTAERVDLGKLSFAEADKAQKVWHRALATQQKKAEIAVQLRGAVVLDFPDGSTWHMVPMGTSDRKTLKMLRAVGASLIHCYAEPDVLQEYLEDNNLYTLYDRRGEPHVTVAVTPSGRVTDAKITGDVDIPRDSRWAPHTTALVEHLPLKWSGPLLSIASVEVLEQLAQDPNVYARRAVAQNPNTPPSVLTRLAQDPDNYVRWGVAWNVNTPPSLLTRLAQDPNADVRWEVALNASTSPAVLTRLARDPSAAMRQAVAGNANTPR